MINMYEVSETNKMIEHENLDVRTITLGISLLDCIDSDLDQLNQNIYNKSKIGINVSHLQATSGFPWRVMDIMASNACLVTDYHEDFKRLFGNIPIPTYESELEAYEVCRQLIKDESRRKEIVLQCQEVIENKYRFRHLLPRLEEYSGITLHV